MLTDKEIKTFVPTVKPDKAKLFYKEILGLKLLSEDNYALEFEANGIKLRVIIVQELKPQEFTVLGWNVEDISSTVKTLKSFCLRKVSFFRARQFRSLDRTRRCKSRMV